MSIKLVTGVPGAGKSYYAVKAIFDLVQSSDDFLIITNINGLSVDDNRVIKFENFSTEGFQYEKQRKYLDKLRSQYGLSNDSVIYYFIDEAQLIIPSDLRDKDTIYFFDVHRHLGLEIYLITQNSYKISKRVSVLADLEYQAVNPSINVIGGFLYNVKSGGERFRRERLKIDQNVFALYKSLEVGKGKVKKERRMIYLLVFFVLLIFVGMYSFLNTEVVSSDKGSQEQVSSKSDSQSLDRSKSVSSSSSSSSGETSPDNKGNFHKYGVPPILQYSVSRDKLKIFKNNMKFWIEPMKYVSRFLDSFTRLSYVYVSGSQFKLFNSQTKKFLFPNRINYPNYPNRILKKDDKERDYKKSSEILDN